MKNTETSALLTSIQTLKCFDAQWQLPPNLAFTKKFVLTDWQSFFTALFTQRSLWRQHFKDKCPNFHLILPSCALLMLQGLSAALDDRPQIQDSLNTLSLLGEWDFLEAEFTETFKVLVLKLAQKGLTQLYLEEVQDLTASFSEENCETLSNFIEHHQLALEVILPKRYQSSKWQRRLDQCAWTQYRQLGLSDDLIKRQPELPKRIRHTRHQALIEIGVSLDQQVEQTQTIPVDKNTSIASSNHEYTAQDVWGWDTFKEKFDQRQLNLLPHDYLRCVTETDWDNWLGTFDIRKSISIIGGLDQQACEQLLRFYPQFQFGLDINGHLPAGFFQWSTDSCSRILSYDQEKAIQASIEPMAVQYYTPAYPPPALSPRLVKQWVQQVNSCTTPTAAEAFTLRCWTQLNQGIYDRQAHIHFRQYLPTLLHLSDTAIQTLIPIVNETGLIHFSRLDFLLNHLAAIQALLAEAALDRLPPAARAVLVEEVGEHQLPQVLVFAQCAQKTVGTTPRSATLLYRLLTDPPSNSILTQLDTWVDYLSLSPDNIDALLPVYTKHSTQGLETLFACWAKLDQFRLAETAHAPQTTLLKVCHESLFSKLPSYLPLLTKDYQTALDILQGFYIKPAQGHWWQSLFQQHCTAVGVDDLPQLVKAFKFFSEQIEAFGLSFYEDCQFKQIKSLPVALSRMLKLLQHCAPKHRVGQWHCITQLDLNSTGTIVITISHPYIPRYTFVTPEMRIQKDTLYTIIQKPDEPFETLHTLSGKHLSSAIDRWLATQTHSCSLQFYQQAKAIMKTNKFREGATQQLTLTLIKSTTGLWNQLILSKESEGNLLEKWAKLCKNLDEKAKEALTSAKKIASVLFQIAKQPSIMRELSETFSELLQINIPPFPILCEILGDVLSWEFNEIITFARRHNNGKKITRFFGELAYIGVQFQKTNQTRSKYNSYEKYNHYLDVLLAIQFASEYSSQFLGDHFSNQFFKNLAALISTFQLEANQITGLQDTFIQYHQNQSLSEAYLDCLQKSVQHLQYMQNNKDPQNPDQILSIQALNEFLNELYQYIHVPDIVPELYKYLIKKHFFANYSPEFFEILATGQLPSELQTAISQHFDLEENRAHIQNCLCYFPNLEVQTGQETILLLTAIVEPLSQVCRKSFFKQLLKLVSYCAPNLELTSFNSLLNALIARSHIHEFEYFIQHIAQAKLANTPDLLLKAVAYQQVCCVHAKQAFQHQHLHTADRLLLIIHFILALPIHELNDLIHPHLTQSATQTVMGNSSTHSTQEKTAGHDSSLRFNQFLHTIDQLIARYPTAKDLLIKQLIDTLADQMTPQPTTIATPLTLATLEQQIQVLTQSLMHLESLETVLSLLSHFAKPLPGSEAHPSLYTSYKLIELLQSVYPESDSQKTNLALAPKLETYPLIATTDLSAQAIADRASTWLQKMLTPLQNLSKWLSTQPDTEIAPTIKTVNPRPPLLKQASTSDESDSGVEEDCNSSYSEDDKDDFRDASNEISWSADWQKTLLTIVSHDKSCSTETFQALHKACREGHISLNTLKHYWHLPPYPTIQQALAWLTAPHPEEAYQHFSLTPVPRNPQNGFKLSFALTQTKKFKGYEFLLEDLHALEFFTQSARSKTPEALLQWLSEPSMQQRPVELIAVLAELLYRSNSQAGEACEINTTQYLALLATLRANQSVFMKMATGEGKSRVFILASACQHRLGGTPDFVTSDFELARRDYQSYQPFFQILSIPIALISATSPYEAYQAQAVHFTTVADLSLFHNICVLQNKQQHFPEQRILLLDEADNGLFKTQMRFNISKTQPELKGLAWIYAEAVQFIETPIGQALACSPEADWNAAHQSFTQFVTSHRGEAAASCLSALSIVQLDRLLDAAISAHRLLLYKDFVITPNTFNPSSQQLVSMAHVISHNQQLTSSRYAEGVHECLHAYLEQLRVKVRLNSGYSPEIPEDLYPLLKDCEHAFPHDVETSIVYSSTSSDLWKHYQKHICITGTPGKKPEQAEVKHLYQMTYIKVPTHRLKQRIDHPTRIVANHAEKTKVLYHTIVAARQRNQPVLVICQDDYHSQLLMQATLNHNQSELSPIPASCFQWINASLTSNLLDAAISKAGCSGVITFGTSRLGRGVDIKPVELAKQHNPFVLETYLPPTCDDKQIRGRTGRQGNPGESFCILAASELARFEGFSTNFYQNPEKYFKQFQRQWDRRDQEQRLKVDFVMAGLFSSLQTALYQENTTWSDQERAYCNKKLNAFIEQLRVLLEAHIVCPLDPVAFRDQLIQIDCDPIIKKQLIDLNLEPILRSHQFANRLEYPKPASTIKPVIFHQYHKALDGRAKIYDQLFVETRATLESLWQCLMKLLTHLLHYVVTCFKPNQTNTDTVQNLSLDTESMRLPFANTRAYWHGHGDIWADSKAVLAGERPLFANTRASFRSMSDSKHYLFSLKDSSLLSRVSTRITQVSTHLTDKLPIQLR